MKSKGLKSGSPNITITSPKSQSIQLENENVFTGYNKKHLINEQMKKTESRLLNNGILCAYLISSNLFWHGITPFTPYN